MAVIAVIAAFLGGTAALAIGRAVGWVGRDETTTVVLPAGGEGARDEAGSASRRNGGGPKAGSERPLVANGFDPAAIYRARAAGVVTIYALFGTHATNGRGDAAQGSGFVVSRGGYILTNSHVITTAGDEDLDAGARAATTIYVEFRDGDRVAGRIVGWDLFDDVGVVEVDPGAHRLIPVPLGDSSRVTVGQPVAAIGSPFGEVSSLSVGVVSATERSIASLTSEYNVVDAIQTDTPINRGNSGGPLLDARGRAIGINAQIRSESGTAEGVGFAIPIDAAMRSLRQLVATGRVRYAWVGITTETVTPALSRRFGLAVRRGAAIQSVVAASPAAKAGLHAGGEEEEFAGIDFRPGGDVVVAIDGTEVETAEDVVREVTERLPGEHVAFTVQRGSERRVVDVVLGERPRTPPDAGR